MTPDPTPTPETTVADRSPTPVPTPRQPRRKRPAPPPTPEREECRRAKILAREPRRIVALWRRGRIEGFASHHWVATGQDVPTERDRQEWLLDTFLNAAADEAGRHREWLTVTSLQGEDRRFYSYPLGVRDDAKKAAEYRDDQSRTHRFYYRLNVARCRAYRHLLKTLPPPVPAVPTTLFDLGDEPRSGAPRRQKGRAVS